METIYITDGNKEQSVNWLRVQGYGVPEMTGRRLHLS